MLLSHAKTVSAPGEASEHKQDLLAAPLELQAEQLNSGEAWEHCEMVEMLNQSCTLDRHHDKQHPVGCTTNISPGVAFIPYAVMWQDRRTSLWVSIPYIIFTK